MTALSDLTPQPRELNKSVNQWFGSWGFWWKNLLLILGIIILNCVFSCMCLYCCCDICLQSSQIATKRATSMPVKPLAEPLQMVQGILLMLKKPELCDGFQGKVFKDRVRERCCGVCDQLVDILLTGWW